MTPLPVSVRTDSLAERSEFELPVPVSKLSDDSIMLEFATVRRVAALGDALISRELVLPRSVRGHVDNGRRIARFLPRNPSRS
jgi:hypothetical protein